MRPPCPDCKRELHRTLESKHKIHFVCICRDDVCFCFDKETGILERETQIKEVKNG